MSFVENTHNFVTIYKNTITDKFDIKRCQNNLEIMVKYNFLL